MAERTQGEKTGGINDAMVRSTRAAARSVIRGQSGGGFTERQNVTAQVWVSSDLEFPQQDFGLLHEGGNEVP
ncbi:MAG TPA: hypothetical protein VII40_21065, partial [Xanthobacteraceae bacterium]